MIICPFINEMRQSAVLYVFRFIVDEKKQSCVLYHIRDNRSSRMLSDAIKNALFHWQNDRTRVLSSSGVRSPKFAFLVLRNDQYWPAFCFLSYDRSKRASSSLTCTSQNLRLIEWTWSSFSVSGNWKTGVDHERSDYRMLRVERGTCFRSTPGFITFPSAGWIHIVFP